jgi:hypothetical protein
MLLICSAPLAAWGPEGHRVIGLAGFGLLDDSARREVQSILGDPTTDELETVLGEACIWPDTIRDQPGWRWSSPLHYVNIPRHSDQYDRERDCAEGRCVTEGILHFANQLTWPQLEHEKRWQAFAFVCHLVADLHQPLHAGFRDDRGGNTVDVIYSGREWNLHQVWDGVIVRERLDDESRMVEQLLSAGRRQSPGEWAPSDVKTWTDQSHALALASAYPAGRVIDQEFASEAWQITLLQWERAAARLAALLNATLGDGGPPEGN